MKICNDCIHLGKHRKTHSYVCINPKSKLHKVPFPHGKTRKACNLFTVKKRQDIDFSQMEGMRFIEDYRGKFQGSDIWVLGCDPNLDCYPDDFFDDKVSITLNYACIAFPNSTYFTGAPGPLFAIKDRWPHFLKKCVIPLILRKSRRGSFTWWRNSGFDPIYMKSMCGKSVFKQTEADFEMMAEQVFSNGSCSFAGGISSADFGVYIAAILGAKRIIIVGCSTMPGNAQKRGMSEFYSDDRVGPSAEWRAGQHPDQIQMRQSTARFAEIFRRYGVEVIKHRFDEKKRKFVFVEIKSEREDLWDTGYGR